MKEFKETKFHFGPLAKTFNQASYVIVDQNIYDQYINHFESVEHLYITPAGENSKNFREVEKCLNFFLERGVSRNSHIVVVGGGATSDFGGFISSLLLRGIKWSVIPTTLLSMVDSSIGGKTGVNSPEGKNLIGAFHLPENVWIDIDFLKTLPQIEIDSGMGEILKYCFLNTKIYQMVLNKSKLEDIVKACALYKNEVVRNDFLETSNRKILNLGHTIGHALEVHYNLAHGVAVRWGIYLIFALFKKEELIQEFIVLNHKLFGGFDKPSWLDNLNINSLMELIRSDKKKIDGNQIELVTMDETFRPILSPMTFSDLKTNLEEIKNDLS